MENPVCKICARPRHVVSQAFAGGLDLVVCAEAPPDAVVMTDRWNCSCCRCEEISPAEIDFSKFDIEPVAMSDSIQELLDEIIKAAEIPERFRTTRLTEKEFRERSLWQAEMRTNICRTIFPFIQKFHSTRWRLTPKA